MVDSPKPMPPHTLDLRPITRDPEICLTKVRLEWQFDSWVDWLLLGEASLLSPTRDDDHWALQADCTAGVTTEEGDAVHALRLPLIGVVLRRCVEQVCRIRAFIDPDGHEPHTRPDFRVPTTSSYDPTRHRESRTCTRKGCSTCPYHAPRPHIIVPSECFLPRFDADLFSIVSGKRVDIYLGVRRED